MMEILHYLKDPTLDYGNYRISLILMGYNAGFISSAVVFGPFGLKSRSNLRPFHKASPKLSLGFRIEV